MNDVDSVVSTSPEEPVRPSTVKEPEPTALTVPWTPSRDRSWLAAAREGRSPEPLPASAPPPVVSSAAEARTAPTVRDRKRVVSVQRVSVRVDLGGRRIIDKKTKKNKVSTFEHTTTNKH